MAMFKGLIRALVIYILKITLKKSTNFYKGYLHSTSGARNTKIYMWLPKTCVGHLVPKIIYSFDNLSPSM